MKRLLMFTLFSLTLSSLAACGGGEGDTRPVLSGEAKGSNISNETSRPTTREDHYLDIRLVDPCKIKACPSPEPETEEDRRYSLPPQK